VSAAPESLTVRTGQAAWLRHAFPALAAIACLGLLTAPTTIALKVLALAALLAFYRIGRRAWRRAVRIGRLQIYRDGPGLLLRNGEEQRVETAGPAWITPWICVIPLKTVPGAAMIRCMVCASENRPENFRRLRVWLRLCPDSGFRSREPL
jgi:hypothetical protein